GLLLLLAGERAPLLRALARAQEVPLHGIEHVGLLDDLAALLLLGGAVTGRRLGARRRLGGTADRGRRGGRRGPAQVDLAENLDPAHLLETGRRRRRHGARCRTGHRRAPGRHGGRRTRRGGLRRAGGRGRRQRALRGRRHRRGRGRRGPRRGGLRGGRRRLDRGRWHLGERRRDARFQVERGWHLAHDAV